MAPLPEVSAQSPAPDALNVVRDTIIDFEVAGDNGVAIDSLQVKVLIGEGTLFEPVVDGGLNFPYDGPGASVGAIANGFRVQLDFEGFFAAATLVVVTIDATNGSSESMPTVVYSFTTDNQQLVGIQLVQIALGG